MKWENMGERSPEKMHKRIQILDKIASIKEHHKEFPSRNWKDMQIRMQSYKKVKKKKVMV